MTLPNRRYDETLSPDDTSIKPAPELRSLDEPRATVDATDPHVDYDRHPLSVRHLGHYIEGPLSDGRFHISG